MSTYLKTYRRHTSSDWLLYFYLGSIFFVPKSAFQDIFWGLRAEDIVGVLLSFSLVLRARLRLGLFEVAVLGFIIYVAFKLIIVSFENFNHHSFLIFGKFVTNFCVFWASFKFFRVFDQKRYSEFSSFLLIVVGYGIFQAAFASTLFGSYYGFFSYLGHGDSPLSGAFLFATIAYLLFLFTNSWLVLFSFVAFSVFSFSKTVFLFLVVSLAGAVWRFKTASFVIFFVGVVGILLSDWELHRYEAFLSPVSSIHERIVDISWKYEGFGESVTQLLFGWHLPFGKISESNAVMSGDNLFAFIISNYGIVGSLLFLVAVVLVPLNRFANLPFPLNLNGQLFVISFLFAGLGAEMHFLSVPGGIYFFILGVFFAAKYNRVLRHILLARGC
jgi:hypothetical protein